MAEKSTFRFKLGFVEADGCEFYVNRYVDNGNWYFDIRNERGVVITCTVNPGERIEDDMVCIKDYSENSGLGTG